MGKTNIVNSSIRFNLENERHLRVYNFLNQVNSEVYKSKNEFIIQALDTYFQGVGEMIREEEHEDREKILLEKIFAKTQEAVIGALGCFYAGGNQDEGDRKWRVELVLGKKRRKE